MTITDLTGAILEDLEFIDIDLSGAIFTNAILRNVEMKNINLSNTIFTNATLFNVDLTGADLTGADLTGADLTSSIFSETTKFSDGLIYLNTIDKFHVNRMRFKKAIDHRNDNITMKTDRDIINININNIVDSSYIKPKKIKLSNNNIESRRNIFNTLSSKREKEFYRKFFYREMIEKMNEHIQLKLNNFQEKNFYFSN